MTERLRTIRSVLTMDAGDATDQLSLAYVRWRRRHRLLTALLDVCVLGASFLMLWWAAGLRVAVIVIGGICAVTAAAFVAGVVWFAIRFILDRRHRRRPM